MNPVAKRKKLKAQGVRLINGNLKSTWITYEQGIDDDDNVEGYGEFFTFEAGKNIIKLYWDDLAKQTTRLENLKDFFDKLTNDEALNEKDKFLEAFKVLHKEALEFHQASLDNSTVAVEIGKEMLLSLLSQPGCKGIRFYTARGVKVTTNSAGASTYSLKQEGEITLVATGIDENKNDLGVLPRL